MLTHDTCSLSSICSQKPRQWMPRLCHALTSLLVFICWGPTDNADPPTSPQMRPFPLKREAENVNCNIPTICEGEPVGNKSPEKISYHRYKHSDTEMDAVINYLASIVNGTASVPHLSTPTDMLHLERVDGKANASSIRNHGLQGQSELGPQTLIMASQKSQDFWLLLCLWWCTA